LSRLSTNSIRRVVAGGWGLLEPGERRQFHALALLTVVAAGLEMFALASVVPVISVVLDPTRMSEGRGIATLWVWLGKPGFGAFLAIMAAGSIALILASSALNLLSTHVVQRRGAIWQSRVAARLMHRCLDAPYVWFLDKHSLLLARLFSNDIMFWWRDVMHRLLLTIGGLFTLALAISLVLAVAPLTGLLVIAATIVAAGAVFMPVQPLLKRRARENRETADSMMRTASDGISGVKDIKVSGRQSHFAALFAEAFRVSVESRAQVTTLNHVGPTLLVLGGQVALVAAGVSMSIAGVGAAEISVLMALMLLVASRVIPAMNRIAAALNRFTDVAPFIDDLVAIDRELAAMSRMSTGHAGADVMIGAWSRLDVDGLRFRYPAASEVVLIGASFEVERGKSYGIVGGSGAGKTTLVDLLLGLLVPTGGRISFDGQAVESLAVPAWQRQIAYVPQSPFLLDDTLRANIAFGLDVAPGDDAAVWQAAERAQIAEFVRSLPQGLDTRIGERGMRLSGGQRQRIAIARALFREPSILVLDEATNALDAVSEQAVQQAIESLHGSVTTIVIAHRMSAVRNCDAILVLESGRVVATGTFEALMDRSESFRQLASAAS
jgi:ABC-type multidrug transport system fused ATPase/permease subunit